MTIETNDFRHKAVGCVPVKASVHDPKCILSTLQTAEIVYERHVWMHNSAEVLLIRNSMIHSMYHTLPGCLHQPSRRYFGGFR